MQFSKKIQSNGNVCEYDGKSAARKSVELMTVEYNSFKENAMSA